jgi:hypothetical protein
MNKEALPMTKRILSLALSLLLIVALAVPFAFAAEEETTAPEATDETSDATTEEPAEGTDEPTEEPAEGTDEPADEPAEEPAEEVTVSPTPSTVSVDGEAKEFEAYNIGGNNFFKLRDLAYVLNGTDKQFAVDYDEETKAITLTTGEAYEEDGSEMKPGDGAAKVAKPTASTVTLDGEELALTAYNIGGNNFFKLRDLMKALDVFVGYDAETKAVTIDSTASYVEEAPAEEAPAEGEEEAPAEGEEEEPAEETEEEPAEETEEEPAAEGEEEPAAE